MLALPTLRYRVLLRSASQDSVRTFWIRYRRMPSPQRRPTPQILIVDDEESVRSVFSRMLRSAGYQTSAASAGEEALRIVAAQGPFDAYVVDMAMRGMSGAELGRRLRLDEPEAKILYCTGYSDRLFEERGTLWENEAFIDKPVTAEGLRQAMSLLLFGHTRGPDSGD
jgi:two-component system cell cycle sensor histidine kinase/response regulator CckA